MKRLYRSRRQRIIGGVCGGIAEYFDVDVVLVRVLAVLLALMGGPAIVAYIIAWIIIPEEPVGTKTGGGRTGPEDASLDEGGTATAPGGDAAPTQWEDERNAAADERSRALLGYVLVAVGVVFLLRNWSLPWMGFHFWRPYFGQWWPILLIALGVAILLGWGRQKA
ncbi:MAG TPA: PspC domain-containing protein [Clostridia bacterium]|nr:PspC domain-containing protein [Clostridia bacterium]